MQRTKHRFTQDRIQTSLITFALQNRIYIFVAKDTNFAFGKNLSGLRAKTFLQRLVQSVLNRRFYFFG
jgi:hypothetical protein